MAESLGIDLTDNSDSIPPTAIPPDPKNIVSLLEKDMKWTADPLGQQQAVLFGNPNRPGPYAVAIKWAPGLFSHPHTHTTDRWAYVAKGTSSSFRPRGLLIQKYADQNLNIAATEMRPKSSFVSVFEIGGNFDRSRSWNEWKYLTSPRMPTCLVK